MPGVVAVLTAHDLDKSGSKPMGQMAPSPLIQQAPTWRPLASREVCHVGEAIVVVVAESRAVAEDAAALVMVDTETLDAVVDWRSALGSDAPRPIRKQTAISLLLYRVGSAMPRRCSLRPGTSSASSFCFTAAVAIPWNVAVWSLPGRTAN